VLTIAMDAGFQSIGPARGGDRCGRDRIGNDAETAGYPRRRRGQVGEANYFTGIAAPFERRAIHQLQIAAAACGRNTQVSTTAELKTLGVQP
jgi:hypothetical protein